MLSAAAKTTIDDGLSFDAKSIRPEPIRTQGTQVGVRGHIRGYLGNIRNDLQIDMGCGDMVTGDPSEVEYRTLLGNRTFMISTYSNESVVAEKLDALISIGIKNSRTRDLFDLYVFLLEEQLDLEAVISATANTFRRRQTVLPDAPRGLSDDRWNSDQFASYWISFLRKIKRDRPTVTDLRGRLLPTLRDIYSRARSLSEGEP
jgi:hypothetical protein